MTNIKTELKDFITGLAHVGHIVESIDDSLKDFKRVYGITDEDIFVPESPPGAPVLTHFAFVNVAGVDFELIEPVTEEFKDILFSMPSGLGGINHVAYLVNDINGAVAALAEKGIKPGHVTPQGPLDIGTKYICYLDPADTGNLVIELIELK